VFKNAGHYTMHDATDDNVKVISEFVESID